MYYYTYSYSQYNSQYQSISIAMVNEKRSSKPASTLDNKNVTSGSIMMVLGNKTTSCRPLQTESGNKSAKCVQPNASVAGSASKSTNMIQSSTNTPSVAGNEGNGKKPIFAIKPISILSTNVSKHTGYCKFNMNFAKITSSTGNGSASTYSVSTNNATVNQPTSIFNVSPNATQQYNYNNGSIMRTSNAYRSPRNQVRNIVYSPTRNSANCVVSSNQRRYSAASMSRGGFCNYINSRQSTTIAGFRYGSSASCNGGYYSPTQSTRRPQGSQASPSFQQNYYQTLPRKNTTFANRNCDNGKRTTLHVERSDNYSDTKRLMLDGSARLSLFAQTQRNGKSTSTLVTAAIPKQWNPLYLRTGTIMPRNVDGDIINNDNSRANYEVVTSRKSIMKEKTALQKLANMSIFGVIPGGLFEENCNFCKWVKRKIYANEFQIKVRKSISRICIIKTISLYIYV